MDPTCGHCLGSSCSGFEGFTDPECPEHGTAARAARKAKLDNDIATLTRRSLRSLTLNNRRREPLIPFEFQPMQWKDVQDIIRKMSKRMLSEARSGVRRVSLFKIYLSETQKPEEGLSGPQQEVCRYFRERKIRIVFRENWSNTSSREFTVYAIW